MPGVEELEWVSEDQQDRLADVAAERGDWHTWLPEELDQRWPAWREATDAVLAPWLDQVLDQLTGAEATEAEADEAPAASTWANEAEGVESLDWVTADQRSYLDGLDASAGDWRTWLPARLDETWPEWRYSDGGTLANWLGDWLPTLAPDPASDSAPVVDAPEADEPAPTSDASGLDWVSEEQAAALETLTPTRGDWRAWLPLELDQLGAWRQSAPEALGPWLDEIIPTYLLPAEAADESSTRAPVSGDPQLTDEREDQVETFASAVVAAVQEDSEMAEILANLTPDQLAEVLADLAAAVQ
jgi:hypothetical protein